MSTKGHRTLVIESASPRCFVGLVEGDSREGKVTTAFSGERYGSEQLIGLISQLLTSANLEFQEINRLVLASGPGSFTGLRTAYAVSSGLFFKRAEQEGEIVCVSLLLSGSVASGASGLVVSSLVANSKESFWAAYYLERDKGMRLSVRCVESLSLSLSESLPEELEQRFAQKGQSFTHYSFQEYSFEVICRALCECSCLPNLSELGGQSFRASELSLGNFYPQYGKGVNAKTLEERGLGYVSHK